jgi:hypothetical protein
MADNFNMKQFLAENKLGAYSKLKEVEEAKNVSKEDKIEVIKEWIWFTCDEGDAKDDINKYNKMVDMYFADKDDVTKEDFKKIWAKVTEKYGVGDMGADWEAFPETWKDVQNGTLVNEGEAAYEYEKGKAAGEKEEKEKLAKEDLGQDRTDAEAEKMMDFLAEKNVEEASQGSLMAIDRIEEIVSNLARNISTSSNIPTQEKIGLVQALKELKDLVEDLGVELEMNETKKPVKEGEDIFADIEDDLMHGTDSKRDQIEYLQEVIDWCQNKIEKIKDTNMDEAMGGKNPEGDKLVLRFLKGVAKKFDYPVAQAAIFVKDTIKSLGY